MQIPWRSLLDGQRIHQIGSASMLAEIALANFQPSGLRKPQNTEGQSLQTRETSNSAIHLWTKPHPSASIQQWLSQVRIYSVYGDWIDWLMIRSQCFLAASKPSRNSRLNSRNGSLSIPPNTSTYSEGSLNGAASNPRVDVSIIRNKP